MFNFYDFFHPLSLDTFNYNYSHGMLGEIIKAYTTKTNFPDLTGVNLAIIGVNEDRRAINNKGCAMAPDKVRNYFYQLYTGDYPVNIVDLGNILPGHTIEDTYFAVKLVLHELIKMNIVPIILGGSQDLTYANYLAYENLDSTINIVAIDSLLDLGEEDTELNAQTYLSNIILHQPNHLFNFSNIGYQTYFVSQSSINIMSKLYFDAHRLGQIKANLEEVEPIVRNADIVSFDISAIRMADAPGNSNSSPNGFYAEEACQIARYAGMSDKLSSIGFYEYNPKLDNRDQTAQLLAQIIWCFIDGYYNRKRDFPFNNKADYLKYHVNIKNLQNEIVFFKSKKSDRWWMQVPYPANNNSKYERHLLVPCSYNTYETALNDEMPDQWWLTYKKLIM